MRLYELMEERERDRQNERQCRQRERERGKLLIAGPASKDLCLVVVEKRALFSFSKAGSGCTIRLESFVGLVIWNPECEPDRSRGEEGRRKKVTQQLPRWAKPAAISSQLPNGSCPFCLCRDGTPRAGETPSSCSDHKREEPVSKQQSRRVKQCQLGDPRGCHPLCLAEYIARNAGLDESQARIKIAGENINNLRYADDTILMTEREEDLKSLLLRVKEESTKVGLKLNIKKTTIMASSPITPWQIEGEVMEAVTDFMFLGYKITSDSDLQP